MVYVQPWAVYWISEGALLFRLPCLAKEDLETKEHAVVLRAIDGHSSKVHPQNDGLHGHRSQVIVRGHGQSLHVGCSRAGKLLVKDMHLEGTILLKKASSTACSTSQSGGS